MNKNQFKGFRFQDQMLDMLLGIHKHSKHHTLTAASATVLLMLYSKTNSIGHIEVANFSLVQMSEMTKIPYTTLHSGLINLEKIGLVKSCYEKDENGLFTTHKHFLKLMQYTYFEDKEANEDYVAPYFLIPERLFRTSVLRMLVTSKNIDGLLFLLELFKRFAHTRNEAKKKYKYYYSSIIKGMNGYSKKLKSTLRSIAEIFLIVQHRGKKVDKKLYRDLKQGNKKNIGIDRRYLYFDISPVNELYDKEQPYKYGNLLAVIDKTTRKKFTEYQVLHTDQDIRNIQNVVRSDITDVLDSGLEQMKVMNHTIKYANHCLDIIVTKRQIGEHIASLGAYYRKIVRANIREYIHSEIENSNEDTGVLLNILTNYYKLKNRYPVME